MMAFRGQQHEQGLLPSVVEQLNAEVECTVVGYLPNMVEEECNVIRNYCN